MAQRVALVDVDERLVRPVVREHRGVEVDPARRRRPLEAQRETQPLPIGHGFDVGQRDDGVAAVESQVQPAGQDLGEGRAVPPRHGRIEQGVGVGDFQLVGGVEVVDDERAGDTGRGQPQIEVAERRGMGVGQGGRPQPQAHQQHTKSAVHAGIEFTWTAAPRPRRRFDAEACM